jgi:hypothetical protein
MQGAYYDVSPSLDADDMLDIAVKVKCSCCHARSEFYYREVLDYSPTARDIRERHEHSRR